MFWKMLPVSTMVGFKEKTAPAKKTSYERNTFLASCNSEGSFERAILEQGTFAVGLFHYLREKFSLRK